MPTTTHIGTHRIAPLPVRVPPQPWEDLHSFLSRTAKQMLYERVNQVIQASDESFPHCLLSGVSAR
ncbi:hypothetical protein KSC_110850 [Ktedonobacter sp. SOSP1-52]|uniref:hypothetical protein n=1 Tax=Ktedonobacter sp. SOSP1-52 TaxID=2778366 RepID=UPI001915BAB0|nr:hypothetical protein [Ktedonobacter sp. SOSP1-52]GHO72193.1 hypothetical protein KSC_110850 [Ktedonobacter sp. SOSP1-52]